MPYIAAIDQILKADFALAQSVMALVAYNVLYALPFAMVPVLSAVMGEAARLLVDYYEAVPESLTSDFLAAFCATDPELMSHPDVVAFYVEEGKWVNFLSRCSPEYLEHQVQSE